MILLYSWKTVVYKKAKDTGSRDEELATRKWKAPGGSVKDQNGEGPVKSKKKTYYDIKFQMLINEHPEVVSQLLNGNEV